LGGLQLAQAKPVDDSKIQINGKLKDENGHPDAGATVRILDRNAESVSKSDGELQLIYPKDAGWLINVESVGTQKTKIWLYPDKQKEESFSVEPQWPAADLAVSAMPKITRSADLAYQIQKKASTISEGNPQVSIVIKRQNHLHS